jgi:precorrin-6B methylase 2
MDFETYVCNPPKLHSWDGGKTWVTGGFNPDELRVLRRLVLETPNAAVIETGCGNSSVTFLLSGVRRLVSIDIERDVPDRISRYCVEQGIDNAAHEVVVEPSEWALPKLALAGNRFDMALIDGCHGWPAVFVDFCYVNTMLSENAILVVDDIQLYSVSELANWLQEQYEFEKIVSMPKTLVFRKIANTPLFNGWDHQPYITHRSGVEFRDGKLVNVSEPFSQKVSLLEERASLLGQKIYLLEQENAQKVSLLEQRNADLERDLQAILNSTSWKLTWPLRRVISKNDNLRRKLRALTRIGD